MRGVPFITGGVHKDIQELVTLLLEETIRSGYAIRKDWSWGYANRPISGTRIPSNHSWGLGLDLNAPKNPYSYRFVTDMPSWMPALWKRFGFRWGGDYRGKKDTMHYEFMGTPADARRLTEIARREFGKATAPAPTPAQKPSTSNTTETIVKALPVLKSGTSGYHVRVLQGLLLAARHPVTVDGEFGKGTEDHVRAYQRARSLAADGIVGEATWKRLLGV